MRDWFLPVQAQFSSKESTLSLRSTSLNQSHPHT